MKIRPLDDRIVVEVFDAEETTPGGIVLPDSAKEKPLRGVIVATGQGRLLENGERLKIGVGNGDEVLFGKYGGSEVMIEEKEYMVLREADIIAKVI